uniref:Large subunit GTPase 1 homolog n=1 Tax=Trichuris muris TaxID=70415 RepID=A0A5S6R4M0_TRIMR
MAKKKSNSSVGYSLVKASRRRRVRSTKVGTAVSTAPTTAGQMRSITEETDLEQFFAKAEMRGRDFAAEKLDPKVILNSVSFPQEIAAPSVPCFDYLPNKLRMPRKPDWRLAGNAEAFLQLEQKAFVEWRKDLEDLQQKGGYILTPFEKNLDIWRQLWRVIERSDVVVELLDSRNPLMFRVPDLEAAVKETCPNKVVFLLLSKADLLTSKQRQFWADYLTDRGDHFAFWSNADDRTQKETEAQDDEMESPIAESDTASSVSGKGNADAAEAVEERTLQATTTLQAGELLSILKGLRPDVDTSQRPIVIGMVGYPNVGKSSTINKILGAKRAAVSATPGKTKHLQTLIVDHDVTLCDAPGLVFPALHFGRHHMLLAGSSNGITVLS